MPRGCYDTRMRVFKFLISGSIGISVNLSIHWTLVELLGVHYLIGSMIALLSSLIVGFILQKYWTFEDRAHTRAPIQFSMYVGLALLDLGINSLVVYMLVEQLGIYYLLAQALGSGVIAISSFFIYREIIFKVKPPST